MQVAFKALLRLCTSFDLQLSFEVARTWNKGKVKAGVVEFEFTIGSIVGATRMSNDGKKIYREGKLNKLEKIATFKNLVEKLIKYKFGCERRSLPKTWDQLFEAIMKYVTLEA